MGGDCHWEAGGGEERKEGEARHASRLTLSANRMSLLAYSSLFGQPIACGYVSGNPSDRASERNEDSHTALSYVHLVSPRGEGGRERGNEV